MFTELFYARDRAGNVYRVVVTQDSIYGSSPFSAQPRLGSKNFRLIDGGDLLPLSDNTFLIVASGTQITRI